MFDEDDVLGERGEGGRGRRHPAPWPVTPGLFEDELLEEGARWRDEQVSVSATSSGVGEAPGGDLAVADLLFEVWPHRVQGVVPERARQRADTAGVWPIEQLDVVVGVLPRLPSRTPADEAEAPFRLPGVVQIPAQIPDLAVEAVAVDGGIVACQDVLDGVAELFVERLVGVEAEDPVAGAGVHGLLLHGDKALPRAVEDAGVVGFEEGDGVIGGAGIEADDLIGEAGDAFERPPDRGGVVLRDDADRERGPPG